MVRQPGYLLISLFFVSVNPPIHSYFYWDPCVDIEDGECIRPEHHHCCETKALGCFEDLCGSVQRYPLFGFEIIVVNVVIESYYL